MRSAPESIRRKPREHKAEFAASGLPRRPALRSRGGGKIAPPGPKKPPRGAGGPAPARRRGRRRREAAGGEKKTGGSHGKAGKGRREKAPAPPSPLRAIRDSPEGGGGTASQLVTRGPGSRPSGPAEGGPKDRLRVSGPRTASRPRGSIPGVHPPASPFSQKHHWSQI